MSKSKSKLSPLATGFLWAASMAGTLSVWNVIAHDDRELLFNDIGLAAVVAGVAAYSERKDALSPR